MGLTKKRNNAAEFNGLESRENPNPADSASPQEAGALRNTAISVPGLAALSALSACGGGSSGGTTALSTATGTPVASTDAGTTAVTPLGSEPARPSLDARPSAQSAARFLTQASFGAVSIEEIEALRAEGFEHWLWAQNGAPTLLHTGYLDSQKNRETDNKATDEMSYEAIWQQWLQGADQLRGRVSFALGQIVVISNIAPDIRPYAMSSYMDLLNRNALGNYRTLLKEVTLHPAMGYFLNMIESEKDDAARGIHPNENYAREVLQLFSIGLVQLNLDGTAKVGSDGKPIATFGETEVQGFAKAFSGWTFASQNPSRPDDFHNADENLDANWVTPMKAFASMHSPEPKKLLNGVTLAGGRSPEKDLDDALDNIFNHPNVGPFIGRQLIQHLVTSNPSGAYIQRVASVFNNNGAGVRGDLKAVVTAVLLDAEARSGAPGQSANYGKQREPVIRFATFLRALGAASQNGVNSIHYLDGSDNSLGQSPLLAPSVFNFFSPNFRQPGAVARAGLYSPEFQITTETSVVGSLNFFADVFNNEGYGDGASRLKIDLTALQTLAATPSALVDRLDALLFAYQMNASTRQRLLQMLGALPGTSAPQRKDRVKAALIVTAMSPDFVIQK
jgi:uncharacterized protein (DUF1800 family)